MSRRRRRRPFVVQYASDLHLEFEHCTLDRLEMPIDARADVLALAGDLHTEVAGMDGLLRRLATQVPVVMVAGNHEFYGHEFDDQRQALADQGKAIPDFYFLDNGAVTVNGVRIVGATFWSDFGGGDTRLMAEARNMMTDYSAISDGTTTLGSLKPSRIYQAHLKSADFIRAELAGRDNRRIIVVTHHAPSPQSTCSNRRGFDKLYGSDYEQLMRDYDPSLWIHGHVHESFEYQVDQTTVACNPRRYVGHYENEGFVPVRTITVR